MLNELLPAGLFAFFLVFVRVGAAFLLLPGIGETFVTPRIRLVFALAVALLVVPVVAGRLPPAPTSPWQLGALFAGEIAIGLFFGTVARIAMTALQTAGTIIALETGLASALVTDPGSQQQGAITGSFLFVFGLLLIFATNLHHLLLRGVADSFVLMPPGTVPIVGDMSETISRMAASSFAVAMQIAAPFILVGLIANLGLGLLARLMPQVQVFFVALPLQLMLGIVTLSLGTAGALIWFLDRFEATMGEFVLP